MYGRYHSVEHTAHRLAVKVSCGLSLCRVLINVTDLPAARFSLRSHRSCFIERTHINGPASDACLSHRTHTYTRKRRTICSFKVWPYRVRARTRYIGSRSCDVARTPLDRTQNSVNSGSHNKPRFASNAATAAFGRAHCDPGSAGAQGRRDGPT